MTKDFDWMTSIAAIVIGIALLVYQIHKQQTAVAKDDSPYTMREHQLKMESRFTVYLLAIGMIFFGAISILKELELL
ncbi:hypothetical protein [Flavobacterium sp.]|uniref:hypothetical protein n=1 Tax=Flavobacterium sp. TaxID=239 RepID=UPI0039E54002